MEWKRIVLLMLVSCIIFILFFFSWQDNASTLHFSNLPLFCTDRNGLLNYKNSNDFTDDRLKLHELDYGERLSSMEDGPTVLRDELNHQGQQYSDYTFIGSGKGPERLIGQIGTAPQLLTQKNTPSTKCTTDQPIQLDLNNVPNSDDEATSNPVDGDSTPDVGGDQDEGPVPDVDNDATEDNGDSVDVTDATIASGSSDENKVDADVDSDGQNQDPAKDDDYDATVSTKKYFAPKASFFPDHYLDDARK